MMKASKTFASVVGLGFLGVASVTTPAAAIVVGDGSLADWNVTVADNNGSNFATVSVPGLQAATPDSEDNDDNSNSYNHTFSSTINPPQARGGGQNYDVEFMAAAVQGTTLYIAISTGIRPDNGSPHSGAMHFGLGDVRMFDAFTGNRYNIETGGGYSGHVNVAGDADDVAAISQGSAGTTFSGDGHGHATGAAAHNAAQVAGSVWKNADDIGDPIDGTFQTQFSSLVNGTNTGLALYHNTMDTVTDEHAILEFALDFSLLDGIVLGQSILEIQFSAICGNDLEVIVVIPEQGDVPAPAALPIFLLGLGALALGYRRRRAA